MKNKHFFLIIILIAFTVFVLNYITRKIVNDFFWGNETLYVKTKIIEQQKKYNTVFIGSSLTWSQYIPEIIDSICSKNKIHSYNLGAGETRPPETFYYCKSLIEKDDSIKYIFVELTPFSFNVRKDKNAVSKNYYYFNMETQLLFYIYNHYKSKTLIDEVKNLLFSFKYSLYYAANIGYLEIISNYNSKIRFDELKKKIELENTKKGFNTKSTNNNILETGQTFKKSKNGYKKAIIDNQKSLDKSQMQFLKYANEITKMAQIRGKHVYWVLSPCLSPEVYSFILPIYKQLNQSNKIDLANPKVFKDLYDPKYHRDLIHYNFDGAQQFSTLFANELYSLLNHN